MIDPNILLAADSLIGTVTALAISEAFVKPFVVKRAQILSQRILKQALYRLDEHVYRFGIQDLSESATEILETLLGPGQFDEQLAVEKLLDSWNIRKYSDKMNAKLERAQSGVPLETDYEPKEATQIENENTEFSGSAAMWYTDRDLSPDYWSEASE